MTTDKQNGQVTDYDAAAQKEAEANGGIHIPIKDNISASTDEESGIGSTKRSPRRDCIYITIVVILTTALIGLVVYVLVANVLNTPAAEQVGDNQGQAGPAVTTTEEPTTTTITTTAAATTMGGPASRLRPQSRIGLRDMRRSLPI